MRRRFLYFIEGVSGCSEQMLQRLGIYDRFLDGAKLGPWCARAWDPDGAGSPSGKPGVLVARGQRPPEYCDARQTWTEDAGYFVGIEDRAARPGPQDLGHGVQISGYNAELLDGNSWQIPMVWDWNLSTFEHEPMLPMAVRRRIVNGRPSLVKDVLPAYAPLVEIAKRVWNSYLTETPIPGEQIFADACALLAANYRVGLAEIELLGLLNEEICQQIMAAAISMPKLQEQAAYYATQGLQKNTLPPDVDEMESAPEPEKKPDEPEEPEVKNG